MNDVTNLSRLGNLISDPTRAEILTILMDGRYFPASELAALTRVTPSTISHHLAILIEGGLVAVKQVGRFRYHYIAEVEVANLIEAMGTFANRDPRPLSSAQKPLAESRTCYHHLAGRIAATLQEALTTRRCLKIEGDCFIMQSLHSEVWPTLGINLQMEGKVCIDWTERKPHIGGPLGRTILQNMVDNEWITRSSVPRLVTVTPKGITKLNAISPRILNLKSVSEIGS